MRFDKYSKDKRSWLMSRIKCSNTKPELLLRSGLHRRGFRFTVNAFRNKKLPGKPDIILPKYKTVIFVHGCFWHSHPGCKNSHIPRTRREWWKEKLDRNKARDFQNRQLLEDLGWEVIVIWECEIMNKSELFHTIDRLSGIFGSIGAG